MLRNRILYFLFAFSCFYLAVMYDEQSLFVLTLFAVTLPVVSLVQLLCAGKKIQCFWRGQNRQTTKGKTLSFGVTIVSGSAFAGGIYSFDLESLEVFNGQKSKQRFQGALLGKGRKEIRLCIDATHCGVTQVRLCSARFFDWLRLFSIRLKDEQSALSLAVMPTIHWMEQAPIRANPYAVSGEEQYSKNRPGDDPAELFGVREYLPGDKLNRMHWKLTAKQDAWMVKELGRPLDVSVVLLADFFAGRGQEAIAEYEAVLETVVSLSSRLLENRQLHYVAWYQSETGTDSRILVESEETFYEMITCLLRVRCYETEKSVIPCYFERCFREYRSNVFYISTQLARQNLALLSQEKKNAYLTYLHVTSGDGKRMLSEAEEQQYGIREQMLHTQQLQENLRNLGQLRDRLL